MCTSAHPHRQGHTHTHTQLKNKDTHIDVTDALTLGCIVFCTMCIRRAVVIATVIVLIMIALLSTSKVPPN